MRLDELRPPLEEHEQSIIAGWLDSRRYDGDRLRWFHVPNEGKRTRRAGAKLKRHGLKKGIPDNWIMDRPPKYPECIGTVFELKRRGRGYKKPSAEQQQWLDDLAARGYYTFVPKGAGDAERQLRELGY